MKSRPNIHITVQRGWDMAAFRAWGAKHVCFLTLCMLVCFATWGFILLVNFWEVANGR